MQLLVKGADNLLLSLYNTHIKDKPIILTQKNTSKEETEDNSLDDEKNNEELNEDDLKNCFTLTQSSNKDGITFTEYANESPVYIYILNHYFKYILCNAYKI